MNSHIAKEQTKDLIYMNEIIEQIKKKSLLKIVIGSVLVILGLLIHLIPLMPGSWIIFIGLEILGIRLLLQEKLKKIFKSFI